jgi:hypothetical protein
MTARAVWRRAVARATLACAAAACAAAACGAGAGGAATGGAATGGRVPAAAAAADAGGPQAAGAVGAAAALVAATPAADRRALVRALDDPVRTRWHYVPLARPGIPIGALSAAQRGAVASLVQSGLGDAGWARAEAIVAHEGILRGLEQARGVPGLRAPRPGTVLHGALRHAGRRVGVGVAVRGAPPVGERDGGRGRAAGDRAAVHGREPGARAERAAGRVAAVRGRGGLGARAPRGAPPALRRAAIIADTTVGEIVTRNDPAVGALAPQGVTAAEMPAAQQRQLRALVALYAGRMAPAVARRQLDRIERAGFGRVRFAWAGAAEPGRQHYYRIHGPTVLIEYDNSQNGGNHVHTVWRDLENDFGRDLLRDHYARHRHAR